MLFDNRNIYVVSIQNYSVSTTFKVNKKIWYLQYEAWALWDKTFEGSVELERHVAGVQERDTGVRGMASRVPTVQSNGTDIDKQTTLWTSAGAWHSLFYEKKNI